MSVLAFRRSAKPTIPRMWVQVVGTAEGQRRHALKVHNHTEGLVRVEAIRLGGGGFLDWVPEPQSDPHSPWDVLPEAPEPDWVDTLLVGEDVPPDASKEWSFLTPNRSSRIMLSDSVIVTIRTRSRTIKTLPITLPIIAPAAT